MPITANGFDDDDEDDDDYSAGNDDDDDEVGKCPECHTEVYLIADRCPTCGHWFQEGERPLMSRGGETRWGKIVKAVSIALLAAIALGAVAAAVAN
jgi:hypothetical protein